MTENSNEIKITSVNEFMEEISKFKDKKIVYRGQSNAGWGVTSGAYRRLEHPHPTSAILLEYNKNLIKRSRRYHEELKETITDINLLAKLQHYGAATSLIDFTKNALVSLWFTCQNKSTDGKVFCLNMSNPDNFLEVSSDDEKKEIDKILTLKFRENEPDDNIQNQLRKNTDNLSLPNYSARDQLAAKEKIAIWEPPLTDNRILKQDSFFIFNKEGKLNNHEFIKILILCKEKKEEILKELKLFSNFSEETIFPDFYGFAQNNSTDKPYGPQNAIAYFQRGNENLTLGKYKEAIADYDKAIELNPQYALAYNNRGIAKLHLGDSKEAIADYNKAIELDPKYAKAYCNRGIANCDLGNYEKSITDCNKAIELNPQDADAYHNRGNAELELGKYKEAIEDYNKAIELNPQFASTYNNRGFTNFNLDKHEEAIKDYNKAIEINPQHAKAYCNRGVSKSALGEPKKAIEDYDKAIKLNPQYSYAYYNRGDAKSNLGDSKEAIADYNKAIELDPEFAKLYNNRGNAKLHSGKNEEAIEDYDKAIKLNSKDAAAYNNRGVAKLVLGRHEEAIKDYDKAKTLYAEAGNMEMAEKCEEEISRLKRRRD